MVWRRSLAEDSVDRFNHTWAVLFLLLLSFVTWLLPLSQVQQQPAQTPSAPGSKAAVQDSYTAECWCPAEFTSAYVNYANSVCGNAYNKAVNDPNSNSSSAVKLYALDRSSLIPSNYRSNTPTHRSMGPVKQPSAASKSTSKSGGGKFLGFLKPYFTQFLVPLLLFVLAVSLKLPHILWSIAAACIGLNIHQAIQTTVDEGQASHKTSQESRTSALSSPLRSASKTTAILYLVFKILVCAVVIAELVYVYSSVLPLSKALNSPPAFANKYGGRPSQTSKSSGGRPQTSKTSGGPPQTNPFGASVGKQNGKSQDTIQLCEFEIRQMQNIRRFSVQCIFTKNSQPAEGDKPSQGFPKMNSSSGLLRMYHTLIVVLLVFLLVLSVLDVANLIGWVLKLTIWRGRHLHGSNDSMDVALLIYMAIDNAGYRVARDLEASVTNAGSDKEMEPFQNTETV